MSLVVGVPTSELRDRWVPVAALTDAAGVSSSHLAARFNALRPVDWSELAHTAGHFDQDHFSRGFKNFIGHTPAQYLALRRRFPAAPRFPPDSGPMPAD
ncbi:hypothetical protein [Streptomyces sp. UG1]|uniref:hypothetical protein n=1 Tax=Streptomyces sp. UG1 TaxID=3417652 RepID=UPI003CEF55E6